MIVLFRPYDFVIQKVYGEEAPPIYSGLFIKCALFVARRGALSWHHSFTPSLIVK